MEVNVQVSKVFQEIREAYEKNYRIIVNEGSSRSTKTYSTIQFLIGEAKRRVITIVAARLKSVWCDDTIIVDFKDIMKSMGLWNYKGWHSTSKTYTFNNGSKIKFTGLDVPQKAHGKKQNITWLNEAMEADYNSARQLMMRTSDLIIFDYNPSAEDHWIFDKIITRDDCKFIKSTYKDNPWLEQNIIDEIERLEPTESNIRQGSADEVLWKIYGLGLRAAHKGLIFPEFTIVDSLPEGRIKDFYGLDFGFSNDPTALINIVLGEDKELYFDQVIHKRGLVNRLDPNNPQQESIEGEMLKNRVSKKSRIWADGAEPKTIQDLNNAGWSLCMAADKGPGSINAGIQSIKRYKINITARSVDMIKEARNYKWREDRRTGKTLNIPVDAFNHCWDGSRYGCIMEVKELWEDNLKARTQEEIFAEEVMNDINFIDSEESPWNFN